jgi:FkbM family methyltransferase
MKIYFKKVIYLIVISPYVISHAISSFLALFHKGFRRAELDLQNNYLNNLKTKVVHYTKNKNKVELQIYTPNALCTFRAETFSTKEPETLEWIEEFGSNGAVLYDIGANIGLYSIYHSVLNKGKVIAFEPSFFNLKLLAKNININSTQDFITVVTTPLTSHNSTNNFKYEDDTEGGALSAFGVNFGYDGKSINSSLSVKVIGSSLDSLIENQTIADTPNLVKIDVDGIEHLILSGAVNTLKNKNCRSVLVEVNEDFLEQSIEVKRILEDCGFVLRDKLHGNMFDNSENFSKTYNQIWVRS